MSTGGTPDPPDEGHETLRRRIAELEGEVAALRGPERSLAVALQRHKLHVEQTPLGVIEWDTSFRVSAWNPAAERIFGHSRAEALGQHAAFILPPDIEREIVDVVWEDLKAQRGSARNTNANRTRDGRVIMCEWYNTPLIDGDNRVIGAASLVQDVTAQREAEKERIALQEQLIAAQQAALRELSTPLIPIADGVVVMPLIGAIDSARAQLVMEFLLDGITAQRAEYAILDITGVKVVDTEVAAALARVAQAAKLLGAQVILTGIRAEVARALINLGVDLGGVVTRSNLQTGIAYAPEQRQAR